MSRVVADRPLPEYEKRLRQHEDAIALYEARLRRLGYLRLLLTLCALAAGWFLGIGSSSARYVIGSFVLLFICAAAYHARIRQARTRVERVATMYRSGIARVEDRWVGEHPRNASADLLAGNLYAADLDITGRGSLFELLCTARTRIGETTLLGWLLHPVPVAVVQSRHVAIAELRDQLHLREAFAIAGGASPIVTRTETLLEWAEASREVPPAWVRWVAALLALAAIAALVLWWLTGMLVPLVATVSVEWLFARIVKRRLVPDPGNADDTLQDLEVLALLLREVELASFSSPSLAALKARVISESIGASRAIGELARLVAYQDSLHSPLLRVMELPLLYGVQLGISIQHWKRRYGLAVRSWLLALGEIEALLSLATYSYEHPADVFPVFLQGPARIEATTLGHPLIAAKHCVRNDLRLSVGSRVLLISGSNMSGKSTWMRTVGVNVVLAMCGAPVRAESMQLTPLAVGASLLVNDSLQSGHSRFYAEIERLQRICAAAERTAEQETPMHTLFLLDELLQGTNSRDRLVGAEGVTRALVAAGAIGIITTHDLALSSMADAAELGLVEAHFQDEIVDGRMQFDFQLRPGAVERSNGVALMRMIGLKV